MSRHLATAAVNAKKKAGIPRDSGLSWARDRPAPATQAVGVFAGIADAAGAALDDAAYLIALPAIRLDKVRRRKRRRKEPAQ